MSQHILVLLRHAEADRAPEPGADHARPLTARGRQQARQVAETLTTTGPFDHILASSAERTRATARIVAEITDFDPAAVESTSRLYEADPRDILELLRQTPESTVRLLLIGHNPGLELIAGWLLDSAPRPLGTASQVALALDSDWAKLGCGRARLL